MSSASENDGPSAELQRRLIRTAEDMMASTRKRKGVKRQVIESEHRERVQKVRSKIDAVFEARRIRVTKAQDANWNRINSLLNEKIAVESRIFNATKVLEKHYLNVATWIDTMYTGRREDIAEYNTTGKTTKQAEAGQR